ncbi:MAG: hypothetical protein KC731_39775 [Myxococcales bacterium]|nr:hypothetical protein [Myxococcales bacterium]
MRATWAALALGVTLAVATTRASAQAKDGDLEARLERGAEHYAEGHYREAVGLWQEVLEVLGEARGGKLHYNLGLAYQALDERTKAVASYEAFLAWVTKQTDALPKGYEERRADAAARLSALERESGALELRAQPEAVRYRLDGADPEAVGRVEWVAPGRHEIVILGPRGAERTVTVEVVAGERRAVDTATPDPPLAPPPPPPPPPTAPSPDPTPPPTAEPPGYPVVPVIVGTGLTALSFLAPTVLYLRARGAFRDADDLGPGHTGYPAAKDEFEGKLLAYQISYALPAALAAATLGVAIWGAVVVASDAPTPDTTVSVAPLGQEGVTVLISGRF